MRASRSIEFDVCDRGPGIPPRCAARSARCPSTARRAATASGCIWRSRRRRGSADRSSSRRRARAARAPCCACPTRARPAPDARAARTQPSGARVRHHGEKSMSDMNFLIIDDDEVFSGILARGLSRRGYTPRSGAQRRRGAEAREHAKIQPDHGGPASRQRLGPHARRAAARFAARRAHSRADGLREHRDRGAGGEGRRGQLSRKAGERRDYSARRCKSRRASRPAEEAIEHPALLSVARLEWEHIQRVLAENKRQHLRDGACAEHASADVAAKAGQEAGSAIGKKRGGSREPPLFLRMR